MDIREMHYDFKTKLNKLDSSQNRNILIPEIDRKLNEAAFIMVKSIVQPRFTPEVGLEMNLRTIEDFRTIIVNSFPLSTTPYDATSYTVSLSDLTEDFMFYIDSTVQATKGNCKEVDCDVIVRKHNDKHKISPFDISSFEWREVNIHFMGDNIRIFTDGTFEVNSLKLDYLRKMTYMHNAQDFRTGGYNLPDGTFLTGRVNCELPENIHPEIVDLAVLITSGEINAQDFQLKQFKTQLNQ